MKKLGMIFIGAVMVLTLLHAQTLTPVSSDNAPVRATYVSLQNNFPPLPFDPFPQLPLFLDDSNGNYYYDTSGFDLQALITQSSGTSSDGRIKDEAPPPPGGGGGSGTNSSGGSGFYYSFPTNGLWMAISGITNDTVSLELNNATDEVYEVFSSESLTNPVWNIEAEVFPATNQAVAPFAVQVGDRTNNLFFSARDWTGITSNGNQTPEWWFYFYYNEINLSDGDLDSQGHTLLYDYRTGINPWPNIYFALNVPSPYFNTANATVQIGVGVGVPSVMAFVVDSFDYSNATWIPYNSNIVVDLGNLEGWHTVSVGLKASSAAGAPSTWNQIQLKLLATPPPVIVTSPSPGLVTQPVIQIQGYCPESLAGISYDLSNTNGIETDQQAFVATSEFDTNNFEYTTTGFECFNIPLAVGTNTITLHATDLAGNMSATDLTYIYDPSANTNPPAISLAWPPNNAAISGTNFPALGAVNDPFSTVSAYIINNGITNEINGLVEQSGSFWIENIPLNAGTNELTITATNAAGYGSATNLLLIQSPIALAITSVSFNDPQSPTATVNGTLSGSTDLVIVNGVEATNNSGTWTAYFVPVGDTGTASITAEASSSESQDFDYADAAYNSPSSPDAQITKDVTRCPDVVLQDYRLNYQLQESFDYTTSTENVNWQYGLPGNYSWTTCIYGWPNDSIYLYYGLAWNATGYGTGIGGGSDNCGVPGSPFSEADSAFSYLTIWNPIAIANIQDMYSPDAPSIYPQTVAAQLQQQEKYVLRTGGQAMADQQNVWVINAGVSYDDVNPLGLEVPDWLPIQYTIAGQTPDTNGNVYLAVPNGATQIDITPKAAATALAFGPPSATEYEPQIQANGITLDPVKTNATFCVGQQVTFKLIFTQIFSSVNPPVPLNISNEQCSWTLPANMVNNVTTNSEGCPIYTNNPNLPGTNNSCTNWCVNASGETVSVGAYLILPNGKSVSTAAVGRFAVVAPTIEDFQPLNSLQVLFDTNNGVSVSAPVYFRTYVLPPYNFSGTATYAQLVQSSDSYYTAVPVVGAVHNEKSTGGNYWLDNNYPYALDTPQFLSWNDNPTKFVAHSDNPGLDPGSYPFTNSISITNQFKTYLQFQPAGGIPVTIGRIDWGWSCIATESNGIWSWTLTTNQPAVNWNDNTFPLWSNIFHNN